MKPARCEAEHDIARGDGCSVDRGAALDRAHGEAGEVVIAGSVQPRHFRGLAADERAAGVAAGLRDPGDHALRLRHVEPAGREIIEEEERLGALHDEVVDAHGDEIDADRIVPPGLDRDLELGADAVRGGDEDRIAIARRLEIEERAEAAEPGIGSRPRRGARQRLYRLDERVPGVDIDAGSAVAQGALFCHAPVLRHASAGEKRGRGR